MGSQVRVLVVDDDIDFRLLLRWQLDMQAGLEVIADAADGFEALECVEAEVPDVAVVDLMMPGMDGFELISRLRADQPGVAIVAYSAMANDHARAQLAEVGVEMLTKSGDRSLLVAAIERAIAAVDAP